MSNEAICAIATPYGSSALGIIRVSGTNLSTFVKRIFHKSLEDRKATLVNITDEKAILDEAIVIYYASPKSFTGEDMVEIICHGNQIVMNSIVSMLIKNGARNANPGEFTERAFLNDKIDLSQAEAIADLISASDQRAVRAAHNSLSGKFAQEIKYLLEELIKVRAEVESIINFPEDDDVPELNKNNIRKKIYKVSSALADVIKNSYQGELLNQRKKYVFVGKPNSGKSSLINCLLRKDASIVSNKAGTTRDVLEYELNINDKIINIVDTAGLRESSDDIEVEGISRAIKSIADSDKVFYVIDDSVGITESDTAFIKNQNISNYIFLFNKIDLTGKKANIDKRGYDSVYVSAKKELGIELIKQIIEEDFSSDNFLETTYLARSRHVNLLQKGHEHLKKSEENVLANNFDFTAEELRLSHAALSSILGQNPTEDLLNEIFNNFCIGK